MPKKEDVQGVITDAGDDIRMMMNLVKYLEEMRKQRVGDLRKSSEINQDMVAYMTGRRDELDMIIGQVSRRILKELQVEF